MGSFKKLLILMVTLLGSTIGTKAADLPELPIIEFPPRSTPVEFASGWYLRGDISYDHYSNPKVDYSGIEYEKINYPGGEYEGEALSPSWNFNIGAGYHFNDLYRTDFTIDHAIGTNYTANSGGL